MTLRNLTLLIIALPTFLLLYAEAIGEPKNSSEYPKTDISPFPHFNLTPEKNQIYCDTMANAWFELSQQPIFSDVLPLKLKNKNPWSDALNLVDDYFFTGDSSDPGRVAMAGMKMEGIVAKINAALQTKFGEKAPKVTTKLERPDDILAYAYLFKNLQFTYPFENTDGIYWRPTNTESTNRSIKLKSFGLKRYRRGADSEKDQMADQVRIHQYTDDFTVVELQPENFDADGEVIILAKVTPKKTFHETAELVASSVQGEGQPFFSRGDLQVPIIALDVKKKYHWMAQDIEGTNYRIKSAQQDIKFKLNKEGALLESTAQIYVRAKSVNLDPFIVFNPPFLVLMGKRTDEGFKYYFAAWIGNEELLELADKS